MENIKEFEKMKTIYKRMISWWIGAVSLIIVLILALAAFLVLWFHPNLYDYNLLIKIIGTVILFIVLFRVSEFIFSMVTSIEISDNTMIVNFLLKKERITNIKNLVIQIPKLRLNRMIRRSLRVDHSNGTMIIDHIFDFKDSLTMLNDIEKFGRTKIKQIDLLYEE